jgi:hypothetical protein
MLCLSTLTSISPAGNERLSKEGSLVLLSVTPLAVVAALVWLAPGVIWAWLAYPAPDRLPRLAVGAALGLAVQVDLAAPLAATVGITWASVALSTVAGIIIATALGWAMRVRTVRLPSHAAAHRAETRWFLVIALANVAVCAAPLAWQIIPFGWDPSFHSLLATSTITTGKLPTWRPYEPISLNYPYGAHVAMAELSLLTGLRPDQVFGTLLSIVAPALASLQIYTLARRMWRRGPAALGAVAAYGLLGYWGSVDYGAWGGLPNALGLILVLAALEPFFAPGYRWRRMGVAAVLLSAMPLTHHHVALSAGLVFGVYVLALLVILALRRPASLAAPASARWSSRRYLLRLAGIAVVAVALAAYSFVPYVLRGTRTVGDTSIFGDAHEYSGWPFDRNGVVLWIMAVTGAALALWSLWRMTFAEASWRQRLYTLAQRLYPRRGSGQAQLFSFVALVALAAAFIFGQFVFHRIMWVLYHKDETLLAPPRFLTNMTYFLALYAGPALAWLWSFGQRAGVVGKAALKAQMRPLVRVALVILTVGVAIESLFASGQVSATGSGGQPQPGVMDAYLWVRANTPANALVMDLPDVADPWWAPYLTQREAYYTPLPASEDTAGYPAQKTQLLDWALAAVHAEPRLSMLAMASAGPAWGSISQRPLVFITHAKVPELGTFAYSSGPVNVYIASSLMNLEGAATPTGMRLWWRGKSAGAPPADWMSTAGNPTLPGWVPGTPNRPGPDDASWLRLQFAEATPQGTTILCSAQDGATLYVDGSPVPHACNGKLIPIEQLSAKGPHVIAVEVAHWWHPNPWVNVEVLAAR